MTKLTRHQLKNLRLCLKAGNIVFLQSVECGGAKFQIDDVKPDRVRFPRGPLTRPRRGKWQPLQPGDILVSSGACPYRWVPSDKV